MTLRMDCPREAVTTGVDAAEKVEFSYDDLEPDVGAKLRVCAARIREKNQAVNEMIFDIGRTLNEAKGLLPHGRFLAWLRSEFDWPERTAQRYMRIARVLGDKTATVSDLTLRAMDALTARSTSEELRDELLAELAAGKVSSNRDLVARVKASRRAATHDAIGLDDEETEEPVVASPAEAGRRAAAFIRAHLAGDLAELRRLLARADAAALLAGLRQGAC